ncbi:hypothetical protein TYRP_003098 [Tyrophagus putrescentiae]|nr:hypothetical protein TYRP_003098 [Tyrophagus putrescentiae]
MEPVMAEFVEVFLINAHQAHDEHEVEGTSEGLQNLRPPAKDAALCKLGVLFNISLEAIRLAFIFNHRLLIVLVEVLHSMRHKDGCKVKAASGDKAED